MEQVKIFARDMGSRPRISHTDLESEVNSWLRDISDDHFIISRHVSNDGSVVTIFYDEK